jgi:hypothetical protein
MVRMGTVWDRTAEFLGDNIATVLPVALLAFFVPASIQGNFAAVREGSGGALALTLHLLQLGFAVLQLWGSLAIAALALEIASDRTAGQLAARRLGPALLVSIALLVGVLALTLPIPAVLAASGVDLVAVAERRDFEMPRAAAAFVALYLIALAPLLLWLGARLSLVTIVILRERRMFGAVPQSWRLTRGIGFRLFWVILLYAVVSWVAQLAAMTVFGSLFALVAGGEGSGVTLAGVLTAIVVAAVQTGFAVLAPVFTAKLYLALAARAGLGQTPPA